MQEAENVMNKMHEFTLTNAAADMSMEKFRTDPHFAYLVESYIDDMYDNGYYMAFMCDASLRVVAALVDVFEDLCYREMHLTVFGITDFSSDNPEVVDLLRRCREKDKAREMFYRFLAKQEAYVFGGMRKIFY